MIRIAATSCFLLTLLCPVFCLAEADGACADHHRETSRNCEAMAVGAVVVESVTAATPLVHLPLAFDLFSSAQPPIAVARGWRRVAVRSRSHPRPPAAATRQALLQIFLF